jgi:enoyl-CoA hydratase
MSDVRVWSDGGVRHIELDAPARRNALNREMLADLGAAVQRVADDADARALVVQATGSAFCAGADLGDLFGDTRRPSAEIREELKAVYAGFLGIRDLRIPTIAAVRGPAVGAGFNIAMACDVAVLHPEARFVISFADLSLHPGGGCTWFLTRAAGPARAMKVLLDADHISADDALSMGMAVEVAIDPEQRAHEMAAAWAGREPGLVRNIKQAVRMSQHSDLPVVLELESWAQASAVGTDSFRTALDAFARRRANREASRAAP